MKINKNVVRRINNVDIYELTHKELQELEKALPKIINVVSPILGCFGFGASFLRDLVYQELSQQTFIIFLFLSSLSFALGFFILFYNMSISRHRKGILTEIRKHKKITKNSIATDK